jgi:hypothetical protein
MTGARVVEAVAGEYMLSRRQSSSPFSWPEK